MNSRILAATLALFIPLAAAEQPDKIPDFTKGDTIPANSKHDWNLGPTGMRGWIYSNNLVTYDARQILVTQVAENSPAARIMAVGDVILGVGGQPFSYDPRPEFGKAITRAETRASGGNLTITRWRAGQTEDVTLKLPVLGSYSDTAPYDCEKSRAILALAAKALAKRIPTTAESQDPIPRALNALGLLATGDPQYLPLLKKEAEWAANYQQPHGFQTWYYGYVMLFLSEYALATGDPSVLPGLRRIALGAAKGQSAVGSWGHGYALPNGLLGGYGMMNSPGIPLTIGLLCARAAGIKDPAVDRAIDRSLSQLRFYTHKGSIPYGDHDPWVENHDDNGKGGMAAILFHLTKETDNAEFFARMSLASHGAERDCGHTGNFFNLLWSTPAVALNGRHATGIWMKHFGTWYFDLARKHDGSFAHLGPPQLELDGYSDWDATGSYLLAYALPLRRIYLTGKNPSIAPQLDREAAQAIFNDGIGWDNKDRYSHYDKLDDDVLIRRLGSWSPVVRHRAAWAISRRKEPPFERLIAMLDSPSMEQRYGACQAFAMLYGNGAPGVDALIAQLSHSDMWLRVLATQALCNIGRPAAKAAPKILELMTFEDEVNDPRNMHQRFITLALFIRDTELLTEALPTIDRTLLRKAVRAALQNQDGRARSVMTVLYDQLSFEELTPLLPVIIESIAAPAPSGEMFSDGIRLAGCKLLAKHHIREGMKLIVQYTREQNCWASEHRTPELMNYLLAYGTHAKQFIPELETIAHHFEHNEPDFPRHLTIQKVNSMREAIAAIQASTDTPELKSAP